MRLMILFILVPVLLPTIAGAADVSLAWDPSISPNVTNYRIYYGTASRTYLKYDQTGNVTGYTVKGLTAGAWYFAATALDAGGNESDYSNEAFRCPAMFCSLSHQISQRTVRPSSGRRTWTARARFLTEPEPINSIYLRQATTLGPPITSPLRGRWHRGATISIR